MQPLNPDQPDDPADAAATAGGRVASHLPRLYPERAQVIELPPRLAALIGRDDDVRALAAWLTDPAVRLITLTGPGGIGKTRLAVEAGYLVAPSFRHVQFVPLAAIADAHAVLPAIARAIGQGARDADEALDRIRDTLTSGPALLILDTMEQVVPAAGDIARLLDRVPALRILVTSREALRLPQERVHEVAPLEVPPAGLTLDDAAGQWSAVQLFVARVQRFEPDFTLDARAAPAVVALCRDLEGLPLAIELAAARVRLFSLEALRGRLAEQIDILGGGPKDQPPHQRTMRATIAWSYDLLTEEERAVFRAVAWFGTPFPRQAVHAVMSSVPWAGPPALDRLIDSLVDKHLLRRLPSEGEGTEFLMLAGIRVFGRDASRQAGEEDRLRDAHAAWIVSFATGALTLRPDGTIATSALPTVERAYPDIERVLAWFEDRRRPDALLELGIALAPFWTHRFARAEGRRWLERALALSTPDTPEPLLARAELELAALRRTSRSGDPGDALRIARSSLERYRRLGDAFGQVAALNMIGVLQRAQGALDEASQSFEEALTVSATLEQPWWEALILCNLGATALWRGETREARHRLEEAARGFRALDDHRGVAFTLHLLALVRCTQGDARSAASLAIEGLDAARTAEAMETTIDLIAAAGVIAAAGGEFAPAITLLEGADLLSSRAMYRIERPERDVYEDAERIARRALGLSQAERHLREVDRLSLDAAVDLARTVLARVATYSSATMGVPAPEGPDLAIHDLTVRERQVLALMAQRYTDREIADTLDISVRTVSRHVSNIFAKLGLRSRRDVLSQVASAPEPPAVP